MSFLVVWGEAPEYQYEEIFESEQEALNWLNNFGPNWNQYKQGHWYKVYKEHFIATDHEWGLL